MSSAFQDYVEGLQGAADPQRLCKVMSSVIERYELPSFAYLARHRQWQRPTRLITNYPPAWKQHYQARGYENADPVVAQAQVTPIAFDWSADLASDDEAALRFFGEASDFGIRYGRTIPIHDQSGWMAAVTYATDRIRPTYRTCIKRNADTLQLIALYFHLHAQRAFELQDFYGGQHLTDRELECLYWASQGKSARDIGEILGLSESTVKFHLRNVRDKFRVGTTIQAAIAFDRAQRCKAGRDHDGILNISPV